MSTFFRIRIDCVVEVPGDAPLPAWPTRLVEEGIANLIDEGKIKEPCYLLGAARTKVDRVSERAARAQESGAIQPDWVRHDDQ